MNTYPKNYFPTNIAPSHGLFVARQKLFDCMVDRIKINLNNRTYLVQSIEIEDGSGHNFNVRLLHCASGQTCTVFMKG
jgi:hypothetical protein